MKRFAKLGLIIVIAVTVISAQYVIRHVRQTAVQPLIGSPTTTAAPLLPADTQAVSGKPVYLTIPSLNISAEVVPGYFNKTSKQWTVSNSKLNFATNTTEPNTSAGNTFIYGHNKKGLFQSLPQIKSGAEAEVMTDNGHHFKYRLVSRRDTNPNDPTPLQYQAKPILTLQTCTGLFYQNRSLFTFELEAVS